MIIRKQRKEMRRPKGGTLRLSLNTRCVPLQRGSMAVFLRSKGFSARASRTITRPAGVRVLPDRQLQQLCEVFHCTPNGLFTWHGPDTHLLAALNEPPMHRLQMVTFGLKQHDMEALLSRAEEMLKERKAATSHVGGRLFLNIGRLIAERQQELPRRYLIKKGFTPGEVQGLLSAERKAVRLPVLQLLCEVFGCLPDDLYDHEGNAQQLLHVLHRPKPLRLEDALEQLPLEDRWAVLRELLGR